MHNVEFPGLGINLFVSPVAEEKEEKAKITDMSELRKQGVTILSGKLFTLCLVWTAPLFLFLLSYFVTYLQFLLFEISVILSGELFSFSFALYCSPFLWHILLDETLKNIAVEK